MALRENFSFRPASTSIGKDSNAGTALVRELNFEAGDAKTRLLVSGLFGPVSFPIARLSCSLHPTTFDEDTFTTTYLEMYPTLCGM